VATEGAGDPLDFEETETLESFGKALDLTPTGLRRFARINGALHASVDFSHSHPEDMVEIPAATYMKALSPQTPAPSPSLHSPLQLSGVRDKRGTTNTFATSIEDGEN